MPWAFPVNPLDVIEITHSYVCLDQLVQYKYDVVIGGAGPATTSDQLISDVQSAWGAVAANLGTSTKHAQTRVQRITDCILGATGKPRRVRTVLDKEGPNAIMDGATAGPFCPLNNTISVQLINAGNPRQFWGKKGFGQLPLTALGSDGEKVATLVRAAWDGTTTTFFVGSHSLGGGPLTFTCGVLPTTYVANLPGPHANMDTYFFPWLGVEVGNYLGNQRTRDIAPQATLGH